MRSSADFAALGVVVARIAMLVLSCGDDAVVAPPSVPAPSTDRALAVAATDREALVALYNAVWGRRGPGPLVPRSEWPDRRLGV